MVRSVKSGRQLTRRRECSTGPAAGLPSRLPPPMRGGRTHRPAGSPCADTVRSAYTGRAFYHGRRTMTCRVAKIHCLGVLLLTLAAVAGPVMAASDVLTLGRISDDPRNHYGQLKPLLDYIVPRMQDLGIRQGRVLMARDVRQMANYLRRGSVDWVTETPGMAMELRNLAGAQPLLLTERNGSASYRSYIIVRRDSGIRDLAGLTGRSIAFEYVASTSAYLVPVSELLQAGLPLDPLTAIGDTPRNGAVGYLFSRSETNTAMWVAKGLVSA